MRSQSFSDPIVPDILIHQTLGNMPLNQIYWIRPTSPDSYEAANIFACKKAGATDDDHKFLGGYESTAIDKTMTSPEEFEGAIGIMTVLTAGNDDVKPERHYIADLRFIEPGSLSEIDFSNPPDDQEENNAYLNDLKDLFFIDAFVACWDANDDVDDDLTLSQLKYAYYGSSYLYPDLDRMVADINQNIKEHYADDKTAEGVETDNTTADLDSNNTDDESSDLASQASLSNTTQITSDGSSGLKLPLSSMLMSILASVGVSLVVCVLTVLLTTR